LTVVVLLRLIVALLSLSL